MPADVAHFGTAIPPSLINTQWSASGNLLSYDVQVKNATGKFLVNGTLGLAIASQKGFIHDRA